jgi:hypothetical protein
MKKEAFLAGAVEADVALPDGVLQLLTPERRRTSQSPLRITAAAQAAASFRTDRGMRECPGFEVTITGLHQPCVVLDPRQSFWWPRTAQQWADAPTGQFARIEADGRTMHVVAHGGYWTDRERTPHRAGRALTGRHRVLRKVGRGGISPDGHAPPDP